MIHDRSTRQVRPIAFDFGLMSLFDVVLGGIQEVRRVLLSFCGVPQAEEGVPLRYGHLFRTLTVHCRYGASSSYIPTQVDPPRMVGSDNHRAPLNKYSYHSGATAMYKCAYSVWSTGSRWQTNARVSSSSILSPTPRRLESR